MNILLISPGFILAIFIVVMYEIGLRKQENKVKLQNKVHFYVTRDRSNNELWLWLGKPYRGTQSWIGHSKTRLIAISDEFYKYGLNVADFNYLLWAHEPVEVFLNLED